MTLRVTLLAMTVGAAATVVAAFDGSRGCASRADGVPADAVCFHLVRTLSERLGLVAAVLTAVVVVAAIGAAKLWVPPSGGGAPR